MGMLVKKNADSKLTVVAQTGGSGVWGQFGLHRKFKVSLGYKGKQCLKKHESSILPYFHPKATDFPKEQLALISQSRAGVQESVFLINFLGNVIQEVPRQHVENV
jgi:hypothetical protein